MLVNPGAYDRAWNDETNGAPSDSELLRSTSDTLEDIEIDLQCLSQLANCIHSVEATELEVDKLNSVQNWTTSTENEASVKTSFPYPELESNEARDGAHLETSSIQQGSRSESDFSYPTLKPASTDILLSKSQMIDSDADYATLGELLEAVNDEFEDQKLTTRAGGYLGDFNSILLGYTHLTEHLRQLLNGLNNDGGTVARPQSLKEVKNDMEASSDAHASDYALHALSGSYEIVLSDKEGAHSSKPSTPNIPKLVAGRSPAPFKAKTMKRKNTKALALSNPPPKTEAKRASSRPRPQSYHEGAATATYYNTSYRAGQQVPPPPRSMYHNPQRTYSHLPSTSSNASAFTYPVSTVIASSMSPRPRLSTSVTEPSKPVRRPNPGNVQLAGGTDQIRGPTREAVDSPKERRRASGSSWEVGTIHEAHVPTAPTTYDSSRPAYFPMPGHLDDFASQPPTVVTYGFRDSRDNSYTTNPPCSPSILSHSSAHSRSSSTAPSIAPSIFSNYSSITSNTHSSATSYSNRSTRSGEPWQRTSSSAKSQRASSVERRSEHGSERTASGADQTNMLQDGTIRIQVDSSKGIEFSGDMEGRRIQITRGKPGEPDELIISAPESTTNHPFRPEGSVLSRRRRDKRSIIPRSRSPPGTSDIYEANESASEEESMKPNTRKDAEEKTPNPPPWPGLF